MEKTQCLQQFYSEMKYEVKLLYMIILPNSVNI